MGALTAGSARAQEVPTRPALLTDMIVAAGKAREGYPITSVAFSPNGEMLAAANHFDLRLWDTATGKELVAPKAETDVRGSDIQYLTVGFVANGSQLLAGGSSKKTRRWSLPELTEREMPDAVRGGISLTGDGKFVCASNNKEITLWRTADWKPLRIFTHPNARGGGEFSPDGQWISAGEMMLPTIYPPDYSPYIMVWNAATGEEFMRDKNFGAIAFSPDSKYFVKSGVSLYEMANQKLLHRLDYEKLTPGAIAFSPDGKLVAAACFDAGRIATGYESAELRFWDTATGKLVYRVSEAGKTVLAIAFSPDGSRFAAGRRDGSVRIWQVAK